MRLTFLLVFVVVGFFLGGGGHADIFLLACWSATLSA